MLLDHSWALAIRLAGCTLELKAAPGEGVKRLVHCSAICSAMSRQPPTIAAIEGGILRECSVGLAVRRVLCSIGADQAATLCKHIPGREYDGQVCHMDLDGVADVYEISLVAVPAQPGARAHRPRPKQYGGQERRRAAHGQRRSR